MRWGRGFFGLAASLAVVGASQAQPLTAQVAKGALTIDGNLDEPDWATANAIDELTQASPRPGEPSPYKSSVRVLLANSSLVFGVRCDDPSPNAIQASTLTRDGDMNGDDAVTIVIDPFHDMRTGYKFRVNAAGTLQDGLISGGGEDSSSWDGQWEARALRDDKGWSVEISIPLATLRYRQGADTWGFNVERFVSRDRTRLRWKGASLNYRINEMSQAGELAGLRALKGPPKLQLTPYILGKYDQGIAGSRTTSLGRTGLDVTYAFTSELSGVLAFNPDFAEAEVDDLQVKLDRFPLFFPEKRRFFLEGANQFSFGPGSSENFVPFYSRRVGLVSGEVVPIDVGLKTVGRIGPIGIGVLFAGLEGSSLSDRASIGVGRVTYDVVEELRLGTILTTGSPEGKAANRLAGFDAVWRTTEFQGNQNLTVGAWYARTDGDVGSGRRDGWGVQADYPNDLWEITLKHEEFGKALDPALGFLPRPGQKQTSVYTAYQPRPKHGPFQQFFFESSYREWQELSGRTVSKRLFTAPFNAVTTAGDHLEFNIAPQCEFVAAPFEISNGVTLPAGAYNFTRFRFQAETSESRTIFVGETLWLGSYFGGTLVQWEQNMGWSPKGSKVKASLGTEIDWARLPGGSFRLEIVQARLDFAFDAKRTLSALMQYDSDSLDLGFNLRYRWQIAPGSDLFFVWNRGWTRGDGPGLRAFGPLTNQLALKLSWTFRD